MGEVGTSNTKVIIGELKIQNGKLQNVIPKCQNSLFVVSLHENVSRLLTTSRDSFQVHGVAF